MCLFSLLATVPLAVTGLGSIVVCQLLLPGARRSRLRLADPCGVASGFSNRRRTGPDDIGLVAEVAGQPFGFAQCQFDSCIKDQRRTHSVTAEPFVLRLSIADVYQVAMRPGHSFPIS